MLVFKEQEVAASGGPEKLATGPLAVDAPFSAGASTASPYHDGIVFGSTIPLLEDGNQGVTLFFTARR